MANLDDREGETPSAWATRLAVATAIAAAVAVAVVWVVPGLENGWASRGEAVPIWAIPLVRGSSLARMAWMPMLAALGLWAYLGTPGGRVPGGDEHPS